MPPPPEQPAWNTERTGRGVNAHAEVGGQEAVLASMPRVDEEQVARDVDAHLRAILPSQHGVSAPEREQFRVQHERLPPDPLVPFAEVELRVEEGLLRLRVGDLAMLARIFESGEQRCLATAPLRHEAPQLRFVIGEVVEARGGGKLLAHEQHGRVGKQHEERGPVPVESGADQVRETAAKRAVTDLVVILDAVHEGTRGKTIRGRAPLDAEVIGGLALEQPAAADRAGQLVERAVVIGVVAAVLVAGRRVYGVVEIVDPDGVESKTALAHRADVSGIVLVRLGDQDDAPFGAGARGRGELLEDVARRMVEDRECGVEPQPVDVVLAQPGAGIVDDEAPHHGAALAIEIDGVPPGRRVAIRDVVWRELQQVVPVRPEMVVDDVEDDAESAHVCRIYEAAESLRPAVVARWRKQVDAVVAPISLAGELGDRHQLDRIDAEFLQRVELADQRVEGALGRAAADVTLVDHESVDTYAHPRAVVPLVCGRVDDLGWAVRAVGLAAGVRVREEAVVIDAVAVAGAGGDAGDEREPAFGVLAHHRKQHVSDGDVDTRGRGRPDAKLNAALDDVCAHRGIPVAVRRYRDRLIGRCVGCRRDGHVCPTRCASA